jgi:hypothetical protein
MLDVHPAPNAAHGWRDFLTHLATIVIGLLIAIGLEQSVEYLHHRQQRERLQQDLNGETLRNLELVRQDLEISTTLAWFQTLRATADRGVVRGRTLSLVTAPAPCAPGQVGYAGKSYFAPIENVWTTARESNLVYLLPLDVAHVYARLEHNVELVGRSRDAMASACERVYALQSRFTTPIAGSALETWTLSAAQAETVADAAATADAALRALLFRLQVVKVYLDAALNGERDVFPALRELFRSGGLVPAEVR